MLFENMILILLPSTPFYLLLPLLSSLVTVKSSCFTDPQFLTCKDAESTDWEMSRYPSLELNFCFGFGFFCFIFKIRKNPPNLKFQKFSALSRFPYGENMADVRKGNK